MTPQQHLELICKHLPHKVMYSHNGNVAELMPYHLGMHLKNIERGDDWKLCLRPLSDLVKPCLKGGKVPIEEILRSRYPEEETQGPYSKIEFEQDKRTVAWFRFAEHKAVTVSHNFDEYVPLSIIDKLHQWGFYLGDQSLFGKEIIDINTLKIALDGLCKIHNKNMCTLLREMPKYKCHKEVWALKIKSIVRDGEGENRDSDGSGIITPEEEGYAPFKVDSEYMQKHNPQVGGYYVVYKGNYKSFSPAEAFEAGYEKI